LNRIALPATLWLLTTLGALWLPGCSFDASTNKAHGCKACPAGMCYLGYCLVAPDGNAALGTGGSSANGGNAGQGGTQGPTSVGSAGNAGTGGANAGTGGGNAPPCQAGQPCYLGTAETRGHGTCRDGTSQCSGATVAMCAGQILPVDEVCNALDDDCDGTVDEDVTLGSCSAPGAGACSVGQLRCERGAPACVAQSDPAPEVCNGLDDDCDGMVDNGIKPACYPSGVAGCTRNADGSFTCVGACAAGTEACVNGKPQACTGFVQPSTEMCGGSQAADEDCDGRVDNGCPCTGTQTQVCYPAPLYTLLSGRCAAGMQRCMGGVFGPCEGAITPVAETCANQGTDDDCNLTVDDVRGAGVSCTVSGNRGVCHNGSTGCRGGALTCITPTARTAETSCDMLDEDCDGKVDEDFALATDEANCGACGTTCTSSQLCCASGCRTIATDPKYCGSCGNACGDGLACCGSACVPTNTVDHCGGCGGCAKNEACCGGACVPTNTIDHCGGCGGCAATGEACCNGMCKPTGPTVPCSDCNPCPGTQMCCSGTCSDLTTDAHCGACGTTCNTANGCSCVGSMCKDSGGTVCP
jgi:hypothetical protein